MNPQPTARRVVLAPELFGRSFIDRDCGRVLELWRDGSIEPVLNRGLLVHYLRMLHALKLPEPLVKRWAWWWNAADKAHFLSAEPSASASVIELCSWLASTAGATCVIHSGYPYAPPLALPTDRPAWLPAAAFLLPQTS